MFNSKQGEKSGEGFSINSLSAGSTITGNIVAPSDFRVDGTIKGNIDCSARIVIGETGKVEGDIKAKSAIIQGRLKGTLRVTENLEVHSKASIDGDITTQRLIVENGAVFNVKCTMTSGPGNSEKKSD